MAEISFQGKTFEVDEDGFLLRFDDWCPEWMEFVKESEGIAEITADHQKILDFLQDYYKKNGIAPMVRILSKNTGYKLKEVYELFPSGPGKGACREGNRASAKAQHHDRHRAGGGPGGDAEDVGFRDGIFQQALQHDAADSEACAAAGGDQRAAEAEIPDYALIDTVERLSG